MVLLLFVIAGLVVGQLRGGGLSGLAGFRLRAVWLIFVSLAAELAIIAASRFIPWVFPAWLLPIQVLRFLPLLLFALLNINRWGVWVIFMGLTLNIAVIAANGWRMPVSPLAAQLPDMAGKVQRMAAGLIPEYFVMGPGAPASLWFLSDIIPCSIGVSGFASAGDIVLGVGAALVIQHAMARYSFGRHIRGSMLARSQRGGEAPVQPAPPRPAPTQPEPMPAAPQKPVEEPSSRENPIRLSPRLEAVAGMIDGAAAVADVGCDHGKLSAYLALRGSPEVIAVDASPQSLAKTRQLVQELGLQRTVRTRVGDGLKKLRPGEADVIVMAGLGGPTICGILTAGDAVARSAVRLVLQPQNAVGAVRRWLVDHGFAIVDEQLAQEDDRIYQILAAEPGQDRHPPMSLFDLEVGYLLIDGRHPLLARLMEYKIGSIDTILSEIAEHATPRAEARRSELLDLRARCVEVQRWLQQ